MTQDDFRGILTLGGTILGTKRTPFKMMRVVEDDNIDKVAAMKRTYKEAGLDCLLCLGGNGTHRQPPSPGKTHHRPAQNHRQRHLQHRRNVRLPHRCGHRHRRHRPHPHHGRQPQPRDVH